MRTHARSITFLFISFFLFQPLFAADSLPSDDVRAKMAHVLADIRAGGLMNRTRQTLQGMHSAATRAVIGMSAELDTEQLREMEVLLNWQPRAEDTDRFKVITEREAAVTKDAVFKLLKELASEGVGVAFTSDNASLLTTLAQKLNEGPTESQEKVAAIFYQLAGIKGDEVRPLLLQDPVWSALLTAIRGEESETLFAVIQTFLRLADNGDERVRMQIFDGVSANLSRADDCTTTEARQSFIRNSLYIFQRMAYAFRGPVQDRAFALLKANREEAKGHIRLLFMRGSPSVRKGVLRILEESLREASDEEEREDVIASLRVLQFKNLDNDGVIGEENCTLMAQEPIWNELLKIIHRDDSSRDTRQLALGVLRVIAQHGTESAWKRFAEPATFEALNKAFASGGMHIQADILSLICLYAEKGSRQAQEALTNSTFFQSIQNSTGTSQGYKIVKAIRLLALSQSPVARGKARAAIATLLDNSQTSRFVLNDLRPVTARGLESFTIPVWQRADLISTPAIRTSLMKVLRDDNRFDTKDAHKLILSTGLWRLVATRHKTPAIILTIAILASLLLRFGYFALWLSIYKKPTEIIRRAYLNAFTPEVKADWPEKFFSNPPEPSLLIDEPTKAHYELYTMYSTHKRRYDYWLWWDSFARRLQQLLLLAGIGVGAYAGWQYKTWRTALNDATTH